jgi:hypothetical protein
LLFLQKADANTRILFGVIGAKIETAPMSLLCNHTDNLTVKMMQGQRAEICI